MTLIIFFAGICPYVASFVELPVLPRPQRVRFLKPLSFLYVRPYMALVARIHSRTHTSTHANFPGTWRAINAIAFQPIEQRLECPGGHLTCCPNDVRNLRQHQSFVLCYLNTLLRNGLLWELNKHIPALRKVCLESVCRMLC